MFDLDLKAVSKEHATELNKSIILMGKDISQAIILGFIILGTALFFRK